MTVTVVSWNIARRHEPWRQLLEMDVDVALLQEGGPYRKRTGTVGLPPRNRAQCLQPDA